MSTLKEDLTAIKKIQDGLVSNKVARFSYTQNAYDANTVNGVNEYNVNNEQNIPNGTASIMKVNSTVLDKGYRSQASSITRMLMNHFLGRISYNLNKINDNMQSLLNTLITKFPTSLPADGGNADTAGTANKVANLLTFGSKTYDGSSAQIIKANDLGLLPPDLYTLTTVNLISASNTAIVNPYTAPYDGWIVDFYYSSNDDMALLIDGYASIDITPTTVNIGSKQFTTHVPYPVKKGQVISVPILGPGANAAASFHFARCLSD